FHHSWKFHHIISKSVVMSRRRVSGRDRDSALQGTVVDERIYVEVGSTNENGGVDFAKRGRKSPQAGSIRSGYGPIIVALAFALGLLATPLIKLARDLILGGVESKVALKARLAAPGREERKMLLGGANGSTGGAEGAVVGTCDDTTKGPTVAYGIMVYQRKGHTPMKTIEQFSRMFWALYDECNTYVVHIDSKSDQELLDGISATLDALPNAHQVVSVSVSWAGITVVERTLALMQKAMDVDPRWRYFVNLGHEDYPSASQGHVREWLSEVPDGTNFIKCWPIEGHDFFGQWEKHGIRAADVHVDDFMGTVQEFRTLSGRRGSQERKKTDYTVFKSLQQTMLSRELVEHACLSSEARRLLLFMATAQAPDELYFPTLVQTDQRFSSKATCNDTRHFSYWIRPGGSWHPEYLTLDHLPMVLKASEFYVRKVGEENDSGPLLDVLDSLRVGNPLEDSLPTLIRWLDRPNSTGGGPQQPMGLTGINEALVELSRREREAAESHRAVFL
ncbi:unnamed protein product, partial [Discosporangium mesarthrocarpum]